ncbi:MAG TPA: hypothetical protein VJ476_07345 [Rhizomicrobium sp.]|nr:hypothetical protein [Rhizomicrobium sp.]
MNTLRLWLLRIGASLLALIAILVVWIGIRFLVDPRGTEFAVGFVVASFVNNQDPPLIARDIVDGEKWGDGPRTDKNFTAILTRKFPVGSPLQAMVDELTDKGFHPIAPPAANCVAQGKPVPTGAVYTICPTSDDWKRTLRYEWGTVCGNAAEVVWQTDTLGRIARISGVIEEGGCL